MADRQWIVLDGGPEASGPSGRRVRGREGTVSGAEAGMKAAERGVVPSLG